MADLDLLIGTQQRLGINNMSELAIYHRQFIVITTFLINKGIISITEQSRAYVRGFPPQTWVSIANRLQLKHPDHSPAIPYEVKDVFAAASWVLQGTIQGIIQPQSVLPTQSAIVAPPSSDSIKTENLSSILTEFTKSIVEALSQANQRSTSGSSYPRSGGTSCNFCGKEHFIRECDLVGEYIRAGKCKRNTEGKVVLPSGSFVPRDIKGNFLKDRIDEWHRQNPNQMATGSLIGAIVSTPDTGSTSTTFVPTYQLSTEDRIASLQAELFNLKSKQRGFTPVIQTRGQKARNTNVEPEDEPINPPQTQSTPSRDATPAPAPQPLPPTNPIETPEHPFRNAKDATYAPPRDRNIG
ncbi:hypothetical protein CVT25_007822 [Psilocybe cyanescens]|uniref:CCHC-type domain-containing protein n=1 Tax=Psilocybe cyanescens TaxID=93625 RepID=A0A409XL49_PSICY|nr:hypothetical protein CVT25_007822 [Psilocybe cyanescens]